MHVADESGVGAHPSPQSDNRSRVLFVGRRKASLDAYGLAARLRVEDSQRRISRRPSIRCRRRTNACER